MNTLQFISSKISITSKVRNLRFSNAGIDEDKDPYIELDDGIRIYGQRSRPKDKKYYKFLSRKIKRKLPFECFKTAFETIIRYKEAGLKYGGPSKEYFYNVNPNDIVAEMGAYQGYYTLKLCQKVGSKGHVIAIEPVKHNLRLLRKNIKFNGFSKQCTIVPKGIWNEKTELTFSRKATDHQSGSLVQKKDSKETIPVDKLDNIFVENQLSKCDFMIIQLNGAEIEALQGLNEVRPQQLAIAARYGRPGLNTTQHIAQLLKSKGYSINIVNKQFIFASLKI